MSPTADRRLQESLALAEIGRAASESERLDDLYERVSETVRDLVPADRVIFALVAPESGELYREFASGIAGGTARSESPELLGKNGILDEVQTSGVARKVDDLSAMLDLHPGVVNAVDAGIRSGIYAPLTIRGSIFGVLGADDREPSAYSEPDLDLLVRIANQIAGSVASAQLQRETERDAKERELISDIGRAVSSTLDLDEALDRVFEQLKGLVPADRLSISARSSNTAELDFAYTTGVLVPPLPGRAAPRPSADGLPALVARTGVSRLINNLSDVLDEAPGAARTLSVGLNSIILAPLTSGEEIIGVFAVHASEKNSYTTHDLHLVERLAPHLSGAIKNAQLHTEVAQAAREEGLFAEIGRILAATPDMAIAFDLISEQLSQLIPFNRFTAASIDPDRQTHTSLHQSSFDRDVKSVGQTHGQEGTISKVVLETGESQVLNVAEPEDVLEQFPAMENFAASGFRSLIAVPLGTASMPTGILYFSSPNASEYTERHQLLAERCAEQIAGALAKANLFEHLEREAREEAMLAEVSLIVTSSPEFSDVFDSLAELVSQVIQFDRMVIAAIDEAAGLSHTRFVYGIPTQGFAPGDSQPIPVHLLDETRMLANTEIFDSADLIDPDSERTELPALEAGLHSGMSANLRSRGGLVGNLSVRSKVRDAYDQADLDLLRRVSIQIGGAFANSELHYRLERQANEDALLAEVSRAVSSSPEFSDVFDTVAEMISNVIGFDRFAIASIDLDQKLAHTRFVSGLTVEGFISGDSHEISDELLDSGYLDSQGARYEIQDLAQSIGETTEGPAYGVGLRSGVGVNLRARGVLVGNMSLRSRTENAYTEDDLNLLIRIGAQFSGAFANSELHAEIEGRAREEAILARISRKISSIFDPESALDLIMNDLHEMVLADRSVISLSDDDTGLDGFRYHSGVVVSTGVGDEGTSPSPSGISQQAASTGKVIVLNELAESVDLFPGLDNLIAAGFRSAVAVPLIWDDQTIGTFGLSSMQPGAYADGQVRFVERVAAQLAGWLVNVRLHGRLERQSQVNAVMAAVGRDAGSSLDLSLSLENLVTLLRELMPVDRLTLALGTEGMDPLRAVYATGVGFEEDVDAGDVPFTSNGLTAQVFRTREAVLSNDVTELLDKLPGVQTIVNLGLNSSIVVPLLWEDETVGILGIAAVNTDAYRPTDLEVIERAAQHLAGAVVNSELHERVEQRALEEAILANIGRVVNSSVHLDDVYEPFAKMAAQLVPSDRIVITSLDGDDHFTERYISGVTIAGREVGTRIPLAGSLTERCITYGDTMVWSKSAYPSDYWSDFPAMQPVIDSGISAITAVPLSVQGTAFGVLIFTGYEDRAYTDHEILLAEAVAEQIAGGITGGRLREEASLRAIEESMLSDIYEVISSSLDLKDEFPGFAEKLTLLMPADKVEVNTIDRESAEWVDQYEWHTAELTGGDTRSGPMPGSATDVVANTRESLVLGDSNSGHPTLEQFPGMIPASEAGVRSTIVTPMLSGSDVYGALFIHSTESDAYTEDQVKLAERVALMLTSAVSNASLLKESEMSSRERGIMADIGRLLGSTLDLSEIYEGVVGKIRDLLPFDRLSLVRLDVSENSITTLLSVGVPVAEWGPGVYRPLKGTIMEELTHTRSGLIKYLDDDSDFVERYPGHKPLAKVMQVRSIAATPLMQQGEAIGALIFSSESPDAYSGTDLELAGRISSQIAGAVINADLFARTEAEARERTILAEIGQMAGSTLDAHDLYEAVKTPLNRLIPYDRMSIATFDPERDAWHTAFVDGAELEEALEGGTQSTTSETSKYIAETRQPLLLRYPGDHNGRFLNNRGFAAGMKSLILVPVIWNDQVIAVLALHSLKEYAYGPHELRLTEAAASQIAGAITNARLHAQVDQQAREQALLAKISRIISSSTSLDTVFEQFTDSVLELIPAQRAEITSRETGSEVLVHHSASRGPTIPGREDRDLIPTEGSMTTHVLNSGKLFVWPDPVATEISEPDIPGLRPGLDAGLSSIISVPLQSLDRSIGVLHLSVFDGRRFSAKDVELSEAVADQIAGAMANADLFARTEREAHERTLLAEIGRIIGSSFDLGAIHSRVSALMQDLLDFDRMSLVKVDQENDVLFSLHSVGRRIPDWDGENSQRLKNSVAEEVVKTGSGLLLCVDNPREYLDRFSAQAPLVKVMAIRSLIAAPLSRDGEVFGVLHISSETPDAYTEADLHLVERIATQIAAGVINADLFARSERQAEERQQLAEIGRAVGATLDLVQLWPRVIGPIRRLIPYHRLALTLHNAESGERWTEMVMAFQ